MSSDGQNGHVPPDPGDVEPGGSGGKDRAASGLTEVRDSRLTAMAVRRGWLGRARWATADTIPDLQAKQDRGEELSIKELTLLEMAKMVKNGKTRAKGIAARVLTTMESQNLADDHAGIHVPSAPSTTINNYRVAVVSMTDEQLRALASLRQYVNPTIQEPPANGTAATD